VGLLEFALLVVFISNFRVDFFFLGVGGAGA
jgi:hypothetical protein